MKTLTQEALKIWNSLSEEEQMKARNNEKIEGRCERCYEKTDKQWCKSCLDKAGVLMGVKI